MRRSILLALSLTWCAASLAHADVITPFELDCPPGATSSVGHTGAWCVPTTCATSADCEATRPYGSRARFECRPQALCLEPRTLQSHWGDTFELTEATADCQASRECAVGQCVEAPRCIAVGELEPHELPPPWTPPAASPRGPCGGAMGATVVVVVLLAAGGAVGLRRARAQALDAELRAKLGSGPVSRDAVIAEHGPRGAHALDRLAAREAARVRIEATEEGDLVYALDERRTQRR
jgi:hypothetical protein